VAGETCAPAGRRDDEGDERAWRELAIEQVIPILLQRAVVRVAKLLCGAQDSCSGDVAIFVNMDSADVWTHPELFELDKELKPVRVRACLGLFFTDGSALGQSAVQSGV